MRARQRSVPIYSQVEKFLRDRIRSDALLPGDPIPPESQLVQQFQISRMTVRQALSRLVFEGLVVRYRGRGSFVAEPRLEHTKMWLSFEEEMQARGAKIRIQLLDRRIALANGKVAESLGLPEGAEVVVLKRLRFVDDQVVGLETRYLPRAIGEALTPEEIHNQPLVPAVRRILGKPRTRLSLQVTASVVRGSEAKLLETKPGAPVLVREHIWYVGPEGPVQYGKSVFRADRYQMLLDFTSSLQGSAAEELDSARPKGHRDAMG